MRHRKAKWLPESKVVTNNAHIGTPVFPSGLANLKRNHGENSGVGSIPLKSIVIFKQT